jgi:hypothetical protein
VFTERRVVSRKTPQDGKLEVSAEAAERLAAVGGALALVSQGREGTATLRSMECTCAKGAGTGHVHHFVESDLFMSLVPGTEVHVAFESAGPRLVVDPAP